MRPVDLLFPEQAKLKAEQKCPICSALVDESSFRDSNSLREFEISGLCQLCQDDIYEIL